MKFFIENYGCQMNKAESVGLAISLKNVGFNEVESYESADIVIINTCSVRKTAENRIWGRLGFYKKVKSERDLIVLVMGCMSQRIGQEIIDRKYGVDIVIGNFYKSKIPQILKIYQKGQKLIYADESDEITFLPSYPEESNSKKAFVNIAHGCNNFCSYCIVPHLRGREVSRNSNEIIEDIQKLTDLGVYQITLLGQNVNSYGNDTKDIKFPELLKRISHETDIQWIKFLSSHPKDFTDDLIDVMASESKVSNFLHLALQSGSDPVLKNMNRHYTAGDFLKKIEKLKKAIPGINLTTDIIVGFPGEEEVDFQATLDLVKEIRFDDAFMYKYNMIENTHAHKKFEDHIPDEVKLSRLDKLIKLQTEIRVARKKERVGSTFEVLPEKWSKNDKDSILGLTKEDLMVVFNGEESDFGKLLKIKSTKLNGNTLFGEKI